MIKWRGIEFRLHPLFVLVMLASVATGRFLELAVLFLIVLIHELGHVAVGIGFGWTFKEVKLLPFGGVAEVEEAGALPAREEAWVAIAGPLQNVWLGAAGWLAGQAGWVDAAWAHEFVRANLLVCCFNLLPILPLDGGKLLQAWISLYVPFHRTLVWCARISLAFSAAIVAASFVPLLYGDLLQLNLLAIGLFLCYSNWHHLRSVPYLFLRFLMHRASRSERHFDTGVLARPIVISESRPVSAALRLFMKEGYHLVYVMKRGRIAKVVPEGAVIEGILSRLTPGNADFRFFM
ncbi:Zn-dependent protease [Cohnella sp. CFH 77786]|uniref:site-2 protease family protein n=1 Tax=Cohnella sp. CFH 77786 TaxID=2662265 RepID=UPI001EC08D43|nr:site-2 protease family protein [Cohnella sp. CFH 77786]MBW5447868.1 Zn-dependent protease [Cohnella sp. CFH 77786]